MIARTIVISGARREGILNLRMRGLDDVECTIRLDEKFAACVRRREITTNPDPALLIPAGVGSPPSLLPSRAGRCTL
jgi:hypothetical protein